MVFKLLSRTLDWIENILAACGGAVLLFITFTCVIQVFARYLTDYSIPWVDEINEYALLYIPFLGAAWVTRQNGHIVVDILENVMSTRVRFILDILISLVGIGISFLLFWYGTIVSIDTFVNDVRSLSVMAVPKIYVISIIPIGSFVLMLEFIRRLTLVLIYKGNSTVSEEALESDVPIMNKVV